MDLRSLSRLTRSRPLLRNIVYGSIVFLALYALVYTTAPRRALSIIPHYGHEEPFDESLSVWDRRAAEVRGAFIHAYGGYMRYAAPSDELKPVSNGRVNKYGTSFYSS